MGVGIVTQARKARHRPDDPGQTRACSLVRPISEALTRVEVPVAWIRFGGGEGVVACPRARPSGCPWIGCEVPI